MLDHRQQRADWGSHFRRTGQVLYTHLCINMSAYNNTIENRVALTSCCIAANSLTSNTSAGTVHLIHGNLQFNGSVVGPNSLPLVVLDAASTNDASFNRTLVSTNPTDMEGSPACSVATSTVAALTPQPGALPPQTECEG